MTMVFFVGFSLIDDGIELTIESIDKAIAHIGIQVDLMPVQRQHVVAAALDDGFRHLALASHSIQGDDRAGQGHRLQRQW